MKSGRQEFSFEGGTVEELLEAIEKRFGERMEMGRILVLVNGNGAELADGLRDGDIVTLLPVMSGG